MTISKIPVEETPCHLSQEYADDPHCLEVLLFLAKHPRTRFSQQAVVHALNTRRVYIERALRRLINDGVVKKYAGNNTSFYSLTEDKSLLSPMSDLVQLNLSQWQLLH